MSLRRRLIMIIALFVAGLSMLVGTVIIATQRATADPSIALLMLSQAPSNYRPPGGPPIEALQAEIDELHATVLALVSQRQAQITEHIAYANATPATSVFLGTAGWTPESAWIPELQTSLTYWTDRAAEHQP